MKPREFIASLGGAAVHGWFTEGFSTLDLKQAKAMVDELANGMGEFSG
jgi:hypothetical protein